MVDLFESLIIIDSAEVRKIMNLAKLDSLSSIKKPLKAKI
jgi:hypothetical protein